MKIIQIKEENINIMFAFLDILKIINNLPDDFKPTDSEVGNIVYNSCDLLNEYFDSLKNSWSFDKNLSVEKYDEIFAFAFRDIAFATMIVEFDITQTYKIKKLQLSPSPSINNLMSYLSEEENIDIIHSVTLYDSNKDFKILSYFPINDLFNQLNENCYQYDNVGIVADYESTSKEINDCIRKGVYFSKENMHIYIYETYIKETGAYKINMLSKGIPLSIYQYIINKVKEFISFKIKYIQEQTILNLFNAQLNNVRYINIHFKFFPSMLTNALCDGLSVDYDENKNIIFTYKTENENIDIFIHMLRDKSIIVSNNIFKLRSIIKQLFLEYNGCSDETMPLKEIEKIFDRKLN